MTTETIAFKPAELVLLLAKSLVDKPESVEVKATENAGATTLVVKVAEEDKGKIIGKQGKVIKALRAVVGAAATKANQKVLLDLE